MTYDIWHMTYDIWFWHMTYDFNLQYVCHLYLKNFTNDFEAQNNFINVKCTKVEFFSPLFTWQKCLTISLFWHMSYNWHSQYVFIKLGMIKVLFSKHHAKSLIIFSIPFHGWTIGQQQHVVCNWKTRFKEN